MNTKTMRLPPRRVLTPNVTTTTTSSATTINNNKRKEREKEKEGFNAATITKIPKTATARAGGRIGLAELVFSSNKILAGYLAHEFLTRGTLFGQQWDPTSTNQNEAVSKKAEEEKKPKPSGEAEGQVEEEEGDDQQQRQQEKERYVELANLLKTGGAHLAGIVNPTQLTHFLHKKR
ncbi:uncharacterized protein LOC115960426 [Quercus lobata]|nr:uncharacterized protein LOC115960426 [Quercus lobata]